MKTLSILLLLTATAHAAPEACFTPGGDCTSIVVREIAKAKTSVLCQAYSFTSAPIEKALVDAEKRGVHVEVILDASNVGARYSGLPVMLAGKVPTVIDKAHAIAHNKIVIVDGAVVLTGSFNFTTAAQKHNAENLLVLRDVALAKVYTENWNKHKAHAVSVSPSPAAP